MSYTEVIQAFFQRHGNRCSRASIHAAVLSGLILFVSACAGPRYVWADKVPDAVAKPPAGEFRLAEGDVLMVKLIGHPEILGATEVSADGTINLADSGVIYIAGMTMEEARAAILKSLKVLFRDPKVTVSLLTRRVEVIVVGEVESPGKVTIRYGEGVVAAVASAGGMNEYASESKIYLLRKGLPHRIRFRWSDLLRHGESSHRFELQGGDILVVE